MILMSDRSPAVLRNAKLRNVGPEIAQGMPSASSLAHASRAHCLPIMHSEHRTYRYTNKTKQHRQRRGGGLESPAPDA